MEVTVTVSGMGTQSVTLEGPEPTYTELLEAVDLSPQEAAVLVDGRPVPEDMPVGDEPVTVVRMIRGG